MRTLIIAGGRVLDPSSKTDLIADIIVEKGRIRAVGQNLGEQHHGDECIRIDATGKWIAPGFIDLRANLGEPGFCQRETIASGLKAAVAGGYTTVCATPETSPVNDNRVVTLMMLAQASACKSSAARLLPLGAITSNLKGETLANIGELHEAGIGGLSNGNQPIRDSALLRRAMHYAAHFDLPLCLHAEDPYLAEKAQVHEGWASTHLGLPASSAEAEGVIIARDLILAEATQARCHFNHLSTQLGVRLVKEAKARGFSHVSAEVTPHHLQFTEENTKGFNTAYKTTPPLRSETDRQALLEALCDGTIDCVTTDHRPCTQAEKDTTFEHAFAGINGFATALPMMLNWVHQGVLSPMRMVEVMSTAPGRLLPTVETGTLQVGSPADLVVIDPHRQWTLNSQSIVSKSHNSPLLGQIMTGGVDLTMVAGHIAHRYDDAS